jgi:hypothetical protein
MVQSLENIDKSKVYVDRIEGLDEVVGDVIGDTLTGAVSTITTSDLTAGKILVSDNNGKVAASNKTISDIGGDSDNLSITKNDSDKLQTVGVINQNNITSAIKTWTGTKAEYDAIINWYAWSSSTDTIYTLSTTPSLGDSVYDNTFTAINTIRNTGSGGTTISIKDGDLIIIYTRDSNEDVINKDANTLYNIIDDMQAVTYEAYSKSETYNRSEIDSLVANNLSTLLSNLYPVGSIYIGTQSTCPLTTLISGSAWVKVSEGRVLQGSDSGHNASTTIEAGLPNITGNIWAGNTYGSSIFTSSSGVFQNGSNTGWRTSTVQSTVSGASDTVTFDASRSSSIYGNSNTVQPSAYVVNIWQRTA